MRASITLNSVLGRWRPGDPIRYPTQVAMCFAIPTLEEIMRAISTANQNPKSLGEGDLQRLIAVLHASYDARYKAEIATLTNQYILTTQQGNDLQADVVIALSYLPNGSADGVIPAMIQYFGADPQFYELAHALLALSFPITSTKCDDSFISGNMQRDVVSALLRNHAIWNLDMTFSQRLAERGLPTTRDDVVKLFGYTENVG